MESEKLLEIANKYFIEALRYFPMDNNGEEYGHISEIQSFQKPIYNPDTNSIELPLGGYIYVNGKWADMVALGTLHPERISIEEKQLNESLFFLRMLGIDIPN